MTPRQLTNAEIADLPDNAHKWHNFSEDPEMYFVCFGRAWEVNQTDFTTLKDAGCLCIEFEGRHIVAQ